MLLRVSEHLIMDTTAGEVASSEQVGMSNDLLSYSLGLCAGLTYPSERVTINSLMTSLVVSGINSRLTEITLQPFKTPEVNQDTKPLAYVMASGTGRSKCLAASTVAETERSNLTINGVVRYNINEQETYNE